MRLRKLRMLEGETEQVSALYCTASHGYEVLDHQVRMAETLRSVALYCRHRTLAGPSNWRARPAAHGRQLKAQNLPELLLWGDDSKAIISVVTRGRGESGPLPRSRDQLRNPFPNLPLAYRNPSPASRCTYATG